MMTGETALGTVARGEAPRRMSDSTQDLERALSHDLESLAEDRIADDSFAEELYRALTNTTWRKHGGRAGHAPGERCPQITRRYSASTSDRCAAVSS